MTSVTISLPQDVKEMADAEAARAGYSLDEYVARLILSQADRPVDAETEAQLLKGLRSPGREFSAADFEARKQRLGGKGRGAERGAAWGDSSSAPRPTTTSMTSRGSSRRTTWRRGSFYDAVAHDLLLLADNPRIGADGGGRPVAEGAALVARQRVPQLSHLLPGG